MPRNPIKPPPYKDTLGKRDIVKNMMEKRFTVAEMCKAIGATRVEFDACYGDLVAVHCAIEYIQTQEDRLIVQRSVAYGFTQEQIAARLGISADTLRRCFRRELNMGKDEWIDDVATTLVSQAKSGSVQAGIFLLKARAGWKETNVNELTGANGGPIQTEEVVMGAKDILRQKLLEREGK